jgi:hypothetical protein
LVHGYLTHYDYRQLMNCNNKAFYPVKYETVYYQLACPSTWNSGVPLKQNLICCRAMLENNVKDKSKQVEMTFNKFDREISHLYCDIFHHIRKISL